jgi:acetyltransferase-like isoleucine patch superfamily enzyme
MSENIFFDTSELKYLGKGAIIGKTVRIRKPELVSVGDYSIIDDFTYIPCELIVGKYTHIGANTTFIGGSGKVTIGSFVNIAPGSQIITGSNHFTSGGLVSPTIPIQNINDTILEPIIINDHALLGVQCVIFPGVNIPEGASFGAMTMIKNRKYNPWTTYVGMPLRELGMPLREFGSREKDLILQQADKILKGKC